MDTILEASNLYKNIVLIGIGIFLMAISIKNFNKNILDIA